MFPDGVESGRGRIERIKGRAELKSLELYHKQTSQAPGTGYVLEHGQGREERNGTETCRETGKRMQKRCYELLQASPHLQTGYSSKWRRPERIQKTTSRRDQEVS